MSITSDSKFLFESLETRYSEYIASLKDISYNESDDRYFIEMDFQSLHFDKIPALMADGYENEKSFSVDTLIYSPENDCLYLLEFKENWPKKSGPEIRLKCYDSISKLCLFWINVLGKCRTDFFNLTIKYCLITRSTHKVCHSSFLTALNSSREVFQLKMLENTIVSQTRILVTPDSIFKFLSNITNVKEMKYIYPDKTENIFSTPLEDVA
ncbi:hypothetical protein R4666_00980 [Acinetobacter baumannii]|nr:hypothetical protein [Acinetobacter baumannii]